MFPRILYAIFISQGLLAAQSPSAAGAPTPIEPMVAAPVADEGVPPATPAVEDETVIIGTIADGTPPAHAPEPRLPNFKFKSTTTARIMREEPSGVPGLPAVRKEVTATVHVVEDPHLSAPAQPLQPADMSDPAGLVQVPGGLADEAESEMVCLSATVYDHQRTLLRWSANGTPDQEMTAWSNLDFNHFCGFASYTYQGRVFSLTMGLGNESTDVLTSGERADGSATHAPLFPQLPTDGPAFVVTKGDTSDMQAMEAVTGLHELYKVEGARLKAAYEAREQASIDREAFLRANPPQPKDVTIHIWKREPGGKPSAQPANGTTGQGGNP